MGTSSRRQGQEIGMDSELTHYYFHLHTCVLIILYLNVSINACVLHRASRFRGGRWLRWAGLRIRVCSHKRPFVFKPFSSANLLPTPPPRHHHDLQPPWQTLSSSRSAPLVSTTTSWKHVMSDVSRIIIARDHPNVLRAFAAVGTYYVASFAFSFLKLLADTFVLPGTSVSHLV